MCITSAIVLLKALIVLLFDKKTRIPKNSIAVVDSVKVIRINTFQIYIQFHLIAKSVFLTIVYHFRTQCVFFYNLCMSQISLLQLKICFQMALHFRIIKLKTNQMKPNICIFLIVIINKSKKKRLTTNYFTVNGSVKNLTAQVRSFFRNIHNYFCSILLVVLGMSVVLRDLNVLKINI